MPAACDDAGGAARRAARAHKTRNAPAAEIARTRRDPGGRIHNMAQTAHRLSDIDTKAREATCLACGRVEIHKKPSHRYWRCRNAIRAQHGPGGDRRLNDARTILAELIVEQRGQCAICQRDARLVLDHSHATRLVRGALCITCNRALGMFRDDPRLMRRAAVYVARPYIGPEYPRWRKDELMRAARSRAQHAKKSRVAA